MIETAVDTSVAVPLLLASHTAHSTVSSWARDRPLVLSGHALAETYSVLTRLPGDARVAPHDAVTLIDESFGESLVLDEEASRSLHRELAGRQITGGAVYDALFAAAVRGRDLTLATRDARARGTYEALGVRVELVQ
ncbi:type II toxin-antitoxin system VapC family toxin [Microlunatus parietis]|uniref:Ribonuclease VapC n=1 Tax=Microlunatus parietis TaxID=682979 RepID=A0A7Y9LCH9_9ACTN|nr:type II toxin-antitoxin system VapC family toxin [Microlunatus parietis]NYE70936.1 putative nucleic acid-binding protein [Microlunatus parietis]